MFMGVLFAYCPTGGTSLGVLNDQNYPICSNEITLHMNFYIIP